MSDSKSRPKILLFEHYLEIGGAERAFIGLLNALDPEKVDVDVFLSQHTGEFMKFIPPWVNLLPENKKYSSILRPIKDILKEGNISIVLRRIKGLLGHFLYHRTLSDEKKLNDESAYQYVFKNVSGALPNLQYLGNYDLAISFLAPHNIVLEKINAKKKVCWIHTDYSKIVVNTALELPIWSGFDKIASISEECTNSFIELMPSLKDKVILIENILSKKFIFQQSDLFDVSDEMPKKDGVFNILTIGRFSPPKFLERIPQIIAYLKGKGIKLRWYIIGYGPDREIKENIAKYNVVEDLLILGKRSNPYPYIKACDFYIQPSRYEGKSVTVREAQILGKPVIVTNYPTAKSQIANCEDGFIVPMETLDCSKKIYEILTDTNLVAKVVENIKYRDFSNEKEVNKIYDLLDIVN